MLGVGLQRMVPVNELPAYRKRQKGGRIVPTLQLLMLRA